MGFGCWARCELVHAKGNFRGRSSDRDLLIGLMTKSEQGVGGAGYERLIVTAEVVSSIDTIKFGGLRYANHPTH